MIVTQSGETEPSVQTHEEICLKFSYYYRVQGLGDAIITDVAFVENSIHKQMNEEDKHNWELMKQLKEAEHLKKRLQNQLNLLEEKTGAERIHDKLVMKDKSSSLLCSLGIDGLAKFLQFYEEKSADYDKQLMVVEEKIIQLKNNIRTRKLEKFSSKRNGGDDRSVAQISIFLHVQKPGQMTLELSYLVTSAGWSPSYDVRMISHDKLIQLNYYGKISQQSGEDWNDAKLFLSTARPCKSGDRPAICCQLLSICKPSKWVEITKKPKKWQK